MVDTETKRRSALGMGLMFLVIAPVPDGTIAAVDREHIIGIYAGIAPAAPSVVTTSLNYVGGTGKIIGDYPPAHVTDSGDNLLVVGGIEAQDGSYFGGAANYAQFADDGLLTLFGTARVLKHHHFTMELGRGQNAPTARFTETPYVSYTYALATNDDSHMSREVPGDMDYTAVSIIKVHWYTTDATAVGVDEVRWEVQWASRAPGEDITAGDTTDNSGDIVCSAANIIVETAVETIPADSIAVGDMFGLHLQRAALGDGTSPQAGTVHVVDIEIQYTSNKLGEDAVV